MHVAHVARPARRLGASAARDAVGGTERLRTARRFVVERPWLWVFFGCLVVAVIAYVDFHGAGLTLRYADGRSKLNMARRMWDNLDPGFGQMGGVWLPLPTLFMALTAWAGPFYYSGLSGSLWNIVAFAATGALLYLLGKQLTDHWAGGVVPVLFMLADPSAVYMATTPMAEPLIICGIVAVTYLLLRVEQDPRDMGRLIWLGFGALVLSLLRYEGWFLVGLTPVLLAIILLRDRMRWAELQARLLLFFTLGCLGIVLWLVWETVIFHDPLFFDRSKYSAHVIDVINYGFGRNVGKPAAAIWTYWQAMTHTMPLVLVLLAGAGVLVYLARFRYGACPLPLAPLLLFGIPAYFVVTLVTGQGAIDVSRTGPHYNLRYGLIALPLVALFAGYALVTLVPRRHRWLAAGAALGFAAVLAPSVLAHRTQLLNDRGAIGSSQRAQMTDWLRRHYDGGRLVIEVFKNNDVTFGARIPQQRFITEGNPVEFNAALAEPERFVRWVYVGHTKGDVVQAALEGTASGIDRLETYYDLAYSSPEADLYRLKPQFERLQVADGALKQEASHVRGVDWSKIQD